jgi:hypothetical protein
VEKKQQKILIALYSRKGTHIIIIIIIFKHTAVHHNSQWHVFLFREYRSVAKKASGILLLNFYQRKHQKSSLCLNDVKKGLISIVSLLQLVHFHYPSFSYYIYTHSQITFALMIVKKWPLKSGTFKMLAR